MNRPPTRARNPAISGAGRASDTMSSVAQLVNLSEWAIKHELNPTSIHKLWSDVAGFPQPKRPARRAGAEPEPLYDEAELDRFYAKLIVLDDWSTKHGFHPKSVRNQWVHVEGFPQPKTTKPRIGKGKPYNLYVEAELDDFYAQWRDADVPPRFEMPERPEEYRAITAIAELLDVPDRNIGQYRTDLDQECQWRDKGRFRYYRTRDVVDFLNRRGGKRRARGRRKDLRADQPGS